MAEHHPSSSKSDQDTRLQLIEHFDDIFTCAICLMKLDDPHLCPQCSKLYCLDCISGWLLSEPEQHKRCPNCTVELQVDKLVKVRWLEEAEKLRRNRPELNIPKVLSGSGGKEDICSKHQKDINLYCLNCKLGVCDDCVVRDDRHLDHTFQNVNLIYDSSLQTWDEHFQKVTSHVKKIASLAEKVERNMALVKKVQEGKHQEIQSFAESAIEDVDRQANAMLKKLESHNSALTAEMTDIAESLGRMDKELRESTRSQFIAKTTKIFKKCDNIAKNPIQEFEQIRVPVNFGTNIPDIYETGFFVIKKFLHSSAMVYSNSFKDNFGHTWRFQIRGLNDQLEVYLELVQGSLCWRECRIQLLHPDPKCIINKTITGQFDQSTMSTRGWRNFMSLKTLADNNHLKDNDSLEFLYHIRPCGEINNGNDVAPILDAPIPNKNKKPTIYQSERYDHYMKDLEENYEYGY